MSQGYLVMAQGNYAVQAEYLAKSIRATQSKITRISVITDQPVDHSLFDHVISMPEHDLAADADWKIHNRALFYDLTPYDETVILDADMLFLTDVSYWWNNFAHYDLLLTNQVQTYRGDWVVHSPYRRTFLQNQLPNVYSAFVYFKRSTRAQEFFDLIKSIITNWDTWTNIHAAKSRQEWPSMDVAMAMAVKILDCEHEVTSDRNYPTFTHMKSGCQAWRTYSEDWRVHLDTYICDQQLRLGNYAQSGILHYVLKDFVTPQIMEMFN